MISFRKSQNRFKISETDRSKLAIFSFFLDRNQYYNILRIIWKQLDLGGVSCRI